MAFAEATVGVGCDVAFARGFHGEVVFFVGVPLAEIERGCDFVWLRRDRLLLGGSAE
jgi:hypothetical protein